MQGLISRKIAVAICCAPIVAAAPTVVARSDGTARLSIVNESRWRDQHASVSFERHTYRFSNTSGAGVHSERLVSETAGQPYVRSGNRLFDGLFALALADARLDSVSQIRDDSFEDGHPIHCVCFETGEKWHYVWTRDISYAVDLGLAAIDPRRSLSSLLFKTSVIRAALLSDRLAPASVVAQDTGSGGSWPVSTDRVVWILAASDVLQYLSAAERPAAAARIFAVARDTVEQDRRFAFDAMAGLYRGETSFLDWREQSYPEWTRSDVSSIAGGYAFSTNVLHVIALQRTARLARESGFGDSVAIRYDQWAQALRRVVNARFWQEDSGLYTSYLSAEPNSVPSNSYDLLGLSLAIIHGIADDRQAHSILENYPLSAAGPPVLWPEQSGIPIYHNRAIWPFVTAYALRAAKAVKHAEMAAALVESLMRGSVLSQSNMENFEFLTQEVRFEDGALSGPVINSRRQLWSVAGYLSMVLDTLWGVKVEHGTLAVQPWLPSSLARTLFAGQRTVTLHDLRVRGASVNIALDLPRTWPATGWLEATKVSLNGESLKGGGKAVDLHRLLPTRTNEVRVTMRPVAGAAHAIARIPFDDSSRLAGAQRRRVFAPPSPVLLSATREGADVNLMWQGVMPGASVKIHRNGEALAANGAAGPGQFKDDSVREPGAACYSLAQRFDDTGLGSLPSREMCVADAAAAGLTPNDGSTVSAIDGVAQYADWGLPSQEFRSNFTASVSGWYRFEFKYANSHGPINTGVTAAVKGMTARCGSGPEQLGSVVMPQTAPAGSWRFSTGFFFKADAGDACVLKVADGFNMSYLESFGHYTAGQGGRSGALNRASIVAAQIELIRADEPTP